MDCFLLNGNGGFGPLDGYFLGVSKGSRLPFHTSSEVKKCKKGFFMPRGPSSCVTGGIICKKIKFWKGELPCAASILVVCLRRPFSWYTLSKRSELN